MQDIELARVSQRVQSDFATNRRLANAASGSGLEVNCELECLYITFQKMARMCCEPHSLCMDSTQLEFVQPLRIVYEDFLAHRSVRRPGGQEIEYEPVIDLPQRRDL